eukprot:g3318.t1
MNKAKVSGGVRRHESNTYNVCQARHGRTASISTTESVAMSPSAQSRITNETAASSSPPRYRVWWFRFYDRIIEHFGIGRNTDRIGFLPDSASFLVKSQVGRLGRLDALRLYRTFKDANVEGVGTVSLKRRLWYRACRINRSRRRKAAMIDARFRKQWLGTVGHSSERRVNSTSATTTTATTKRTKTRDTDAPKRVSSNSDSSTTSSSTGTYVHFDRENCDLLIAIGHVLRCERALRCESRGPKPKPAGMLMDASCNMLLPNARFPGHVTLVSTKHPDAVREALKSLEGVSVLGMDTETKPETRKRDAENPIRVGTRPPDLLQLASHDVCVLFRLCPSVPVPIELKQLLEDEAVIKTGVGVVDDARGLRKHDIRVSGLCELLDFGSRLDCRPRSLRALTNVFMGRKLSKPRDVQMSDWSADSLSHRQVHYAATDAWVGRECYLQMADFAARKGAGKPPALVSVS